MRLGIDTYGIVHRRDDGTAAIVLPSRNGGRAIEIELDRKLADEYRLATGDVVRGTTEPIDGADSPSDTSQGGSALDELELDDYDERDEPAAARGETVPDWLVRRLLPTHRLVSVETINGLALDKADERPSPRLKRSGLERIAPSRRLIMATSPEDVTGRILDFAAPLGMGYAGLILGAHGAGLTRTLRSALQGIATNEPDCRLMVLLLRARGEEMTDWRRRFPEADVVAGPSPQADASPEETLLVAELTLASAQRQTELGHHVVLAVDSLTGLWGAMLEAEQADAQFEADRSTARLRIRDWLQAAGDFGGEGLLGSGLGGSLTLLATVWSQRVDPEAEEEGESHPHLRVQEHILYESNWRVPLSSALARDRLFPAIETARALSGREDHLLSPDAYDRLSAARQLLAPLDAPERWQRLVDAVASTDTEAGLAEAILSGTVQSDAPDM